LIVVSGKTTVVEAELPPGAKCFSKPYHQTTIIGAIDGMLAAA
jgi:hypothetical protein